ncbi:MAG: HlyD family type I secretion periplasmic adaptor subunit [Methylobacter sp.]|nr:HlyD family type I secretion periplasmic adaptor subunit [Methylobacter sp.]MDP2428940.1 HlyD family type I secretion periplasmic adaptor subunit [Methylobacter sp.]MDP3056134.1 HlyD family type I secretion periplasmic adaptor subunit [Methylobacter sp.]MDP3363471.1 HlyD family type I secretion periplasmic adaptor subunit [Methylobacter sp.]MDZ4220096.1 HlyD family type I secretion periplasmic adaptor subunit [Methylobacter sp.]
MIDKSAVNNAPTPLHTNDRNVRNIGAAIVFVTFGIFGVWAFFAPMDSSALAPGTVVVESYRKTVQHLDGGIVAKILIKDGDVVTEGQTLITLDDAQIKAQLEIARSQNITLAAQVARLRAERDQLKKIDYPALLNDGDDPRTIEAKNSESNVFHARRNAYDGQIAVLNQRISQISSKINGLQGQVSSKKQLLASYGEEIRDLKELLAEGFADKQRLRDLQRNHALQSGEIAQLNAEIATNQMLISETRLQILQVQKQFQEEVAGKLSEAQALLNDAQERLSANQDKLNRVEIKAPASGMVLGLTVHNESSVITPGRPILDIVPQDAKLVIEAQVSPMDIDRVVVGLEAEVRFSAFKQSKTPKMDGRVTHLSPDNLTDERTGATYYLARVELTPESREKLGDMQLLPGMPAEVLINTGERTLFEYLAQPATNAFARAFIED